MNDPMERATLVLQTFSHLRGTTQAVTDARRYIKTLSEQFKKLGLRYQYLLDAITMLEGLELALVADTDKLNNRLAQVNLSDEPAASPE